MYARGPRKASTFFDKITSRAFKMHGFASLKILNDWPKIVGENLARITWPQKIQFPFGETTGGILIISVSNPGFSLAIKAQEASIIQKISTYFGYKAVATIKVSISKKFVAMPLEKEEFDAARKPKISESDKMDLTQKINEIEDEELRLVFQSLLQNSFEEK